MSEYNFIVQSEKDGLICDILTNGEDSIIHNDYEISVIPIESSSLDDLLQMQRDLDLEIMHNKLKRKGLSAATKDYLLNIYKDNEDLLTKTILAMQVELSEFANETRCFKHWSTKGLAEADMKEVNEEFIDVLHFFLSIANQLDLSAEDIAKEYKRKNEINYKRQREGY